MLCKVATSPHVLSSNTRRICQETVNGDLKDKEATMQYLTQDPEPYKEEPLRMEAAERGVYDFEDPCPLEDRIEPRD